MEKTFKLIEGSPIHLAFQTYFKERRRVQTSVSQFLKEKGIESTMFQLAGNGPVNQPFEEREKKNIRIGIRPTAHDLKNHENQLNQPNDHEVRFFRKDCSITKAFQTFCIQEQLIVNFMEPDLRDYFESIGLSNYRRQVVPVEKTYVIKVENDYLKDHDCPEGFEPIPLSEFYQAFESFQSKA